MTNAYSIDAIAPKQIKASSRAHTTTQFIARAVSVHGDKYDYKKVAYKNNSQKVVIICAVHGDFLLAPKSHISGIGCTRCSGKAKRTKKTFIEDAVACHGNKYSYDKVVYKNPKDKLIIVCGIHGDFEQSATSHIRGYGCAKCGIERMASGNTRTQKDFIKQAKKAHGDRYSYGKTKYTASGESVVITCSLHGDFEQIAQSHISGHGCQKCSFQLTGHSRTGFKVLCDKNNGGNGILYAIKCFSGDEVFYKVGITSRSIKKRFNSITDIPYGYEVLYSVSGASGYIFDLERKLHSLLVNYLHQPLIPFAGQTECFTAIKPIERLLKKLVDTEQLQLIA